MKFVPRLTKPEKGNKYYITKASGGWSSAIKGKPTDADCDVLANCVGYAYGRFNEIVGAGSCKYLNPVNAERFIDFAGNCKTGNTPKLGAIMVWCKGNKKTSADGAGHVAVVEKIISATEVVTSESGYNAARPFWTQTRKKGNGNWGQSSSYKFEGFIYNPAVDAADTPSTEATENKTEVEKVNVSIAVVKKGVKGEMVKTVQTLLNYRNNAKLDVDGSCGPATDKAIRAFQKAHGLDVDGSCGAKTWAALIG